MQDEHLLSVSTHSSGRGLHTSAGKINLNKIQENRQNQPVRGLYSTASGESLAQTIPAFWSAACKDGKCLALGDHRCLKGALWHCLISCGFEAALTPTALKVQGWVVQRTFPHQLGIT